MRAQLLQLLFIIFAPLRPIKKYIFLFCFYVPQAQWLTWLMISVSFDGSRAQENQHMRIYFIRRAWRNSDINDGS